jgi:hypothetical protein
MRFMLMGQVLGNSALMPVHAPPRHGHAAAHAVHHVISSIVDV